MDDRIYVGDALDFVTSVPTYPASAGWTLKYRLIPRVSGTPIQLTSSASGDDHRMQADSVASAAWAAGDYSCVAWVENALGEMHSVDPELRSPRGNTSLLVTLLPNPRTATSYDGRSPARVALDAANAALSSYGSTAFSHVAEYTIGNRSMRFREFRDQGDFMVWRSHLKDEVFREEAAAKMAAGLPNPRNITIRFGPRATSGWCR